MFCADNCNWLNPTEYEQDQQKHKINHFCNRYGKRVVHGRYHPKLIKVEDCNIDEYTLMWTSADGRLMSHKVIADSKKHALSLALSNSMINFALFDYLLSYDNINAQIQQFLWLKNGRIC